MDPREGLQGPKREQECDILREPRRAAELPGASAGHFRAARCRSGVFSRREPSLLSCRFFTYFSGEPPKTGSCAFSSRQHSLLQVSRAPVATPSLTFSRQRPTIRAYNSTRIPSRIVPARWNRPRPCAPTLRARSNWREKLAPLRGQRLRAFDAPPACRASWSTWRRSRRSRSRSLPLMSPLFRSAISSSPLYVTRADAPKALAARAVVAFSFPAREPRRFAF